MALVPILRPATEPVSVSELKAHLRIDSAADDAALASLITTARLQIEAALSLALITQSWTWTIDRWPPRASVELPLAPVQTIISVTAAHADETLVAMSPTNYILDGLSNSARLIAKTSWPQPGVRAQGIEIKLIAGFGTAAADVPAAIRQALLVLVAHWYSHRDTADGCGATATNQAKSGPLPSAVNDLLAPYRRPRL